MTLKVNTPIRALCAFALLLTSSAAFAAPVSGTVTNKTTNKPAASDDVVLISFGQGMQEAGRTKTDAKGHYTIDVPDNGMHLIRVNHQKATYFEPIQPGSTTVNVDVYDVAAKVAGVRTEADVIRVETDPQGLHVIQNYFVRNDSKPPRTQFSDHAYEIYLPDGARIDGSAAMGPSGMPVSSSPIPVNGEKGHFAFVFPIRPSVSDAIQAQGQNQGETRFQVSYHLPYSGSFTFNPRVSMPTDNLVVLMPKSMQFGNPKGASFQPVNDDMNALTMVAKDVTPAQNISFTVSGSGSMPREGQQAGQQTQQGAQAGMGPQAGQASADTRPGGGLGNPIDTPDPLNKYKWWILSGLALVLAAAAAFFLRGKPGSAPQTGTSPASSPLPSAPQQSGSGLLSALKDELFALETQRIDGSLSESEYTEAKRALETVLKRAIQREANGKVVSR